MKRFLLFSIFILSFLYVKSALTATGTYKMYDTMPGIDFLFVFDGVNSQTAIIFNGVNADKVKWYRYENLVTPITLQTPNENFNIENATGYILEEEGGKKTSIWVVDYTNYLPVLTTLVPEDKPKEQCAELVINVSATVLPIQYKTPQNQVKTAPRSFQFVYSSKEWSNKKWNDAEVKVDFVLPATKLTVLNPPLSDTKFKLLGDNFAKDLGRTPVEVESNFYSAVKTECHIVSNATTRIETNEADRPDKADITTASAPLEVVFASNANIPVAEFYQWQIFKEKSLLFTRNDQDLRFTFSEAGLYNVKLTTSNANCRNSDSVTIKIVESKLEVPRVFTPNGDGMNDEFRVAYKSIVEFRCWVFNRWQQKVYYWTDPQKGWDGKINGKPASTGAYYYVIEALGADGEKYNRKGNINLLRGKEN